MGTSTITSGESSAILTVNSLNKGLRTIPYHITGDMGTKRTYRAASDVADVITDSNTVFFTLSGSSKLVSIQRILLYITNDGLNPLYGNIVVEKWNGQIANQDGFTSVKCDSTDSSVNAFPSAATTLTSPSVETTLVGPIASRRVLIQAGTATSSTTVRPVNFDFRPKNSENSCPKLTDSSETISIALGTAIGQTCTVVIEIEWTEED